MINFDDELSKITGLSFNEILWGFKASLINSSNMVLEGTFSLLNFYPEEIEFRVKSGKLKIVGENLKIKKINKELAVISGDVLNIIVERKNAKTKV